MEFKPGDRIPLIASDFNSLEDDCAMQFTGNEDCPIAKALKRLGYPAYVRVYDYRVENGYYWPIDGRYMEVERCRKELLNGADVAYIETID